jgi:hypothetical protein
MSAPVRIAMWSGPRNISTAMMRSFGNRADTVVVDEPFYAAWLAATGEPHPMAEMVIASGETDPAKVAARLAGPVPDGRSVFYQKHMTHHMIATFPRGWLERVTNVFLIRAPEEVVASYAARRGAASLADIGVVEQAEIFDEVADALGAAPPVIDAADVLADPERALAALCEAIGLAFDPAMLSWPPGRRETDGVWAAHWYGSVEGSTGFARPQPPVSFAALGDEEKRVVEAAWPFYDQLAAHRLRIAPAA